MDDYIVKPVTLDRLAVAPAKCWPLATATVPEAAAAQPVEEQRIAAGEIDEVSAETVVEIEAEHFKLISKPTTANARRDFQQLADSIERRRGCLSTPRDLADGVKHPTNEAKAANQANSGPYPTHRGPLGSDYPTALGMSHSASKRRLNAADIGRDANGVTA
jgi:hypothetical protein